MRDWNINLKVVVVKIAIVALISWATALIFRLALIPSAEKYLSILEDNGKREEFDISANSWFMVLVNSRIFLSIIISITLYSVYILIARKGRWKEALIAYAFILSCYFISK